MNIEEWIRVEEAFTEAFGWDEGLKRIVDCKQKKLGIFWTPIEQLTIKQDRQLRKALRHELVKAKNN